MAVQGKGMTAGTCWLVPGLQWKTETKKLEMRT